MIFKLPETLWLRRLFILATFFPFTLLAVYFGIKQQWQGAVRAWYI